MSGVRTSWQDESPLTWATKGAESAWEEAPAPTDSLADDVEAALSADGSLARVSPGYRRRDEQVRMARAVADAIESRATLVVEAGTGVGKTYAYLLAVLMSGQRALISTATKSLQDQLFHRDLPRVREALAMPLNAALLKGRHSYLCLHRMKEARHSPELSLSGARTLARIERWSQSTVSGDLSEVEGLDEHAPILPLVSSTRDNCLGSRCPELATCHVMRARREAMAADVVVVNHHLFFADIALRDTGVAEILPTVDIAVFDEAHQLVDVGVQFLGTSLATAQVIDLARDLLAVGLQHARGMADWEGIARQLELSARRLRLACGDRPASRRPWPGEGGEMALALAEVAMAANAAQIQLTAFNGMAPDFANLDERVRALAARAADFNNPIEAHRARWVDVTTHQARLIETPLDIADAMSKQRAAAPKAWIFTSATLGDDETLRWFTQPVGLQDAQTLRVGSPYDHARLTRLWVCGDAPRPDDPAHATYVGRVGAWCSARLGGRTLVLTTTLRALPRIADALKFTLREVGAEAIEVLTQGELPRRRLLERMREQPGVVVVASQSFWEGVDVPGDALQCVVIDKLPFPPPNDPWIEARGRRIEAEGGSVFNDCFVAEAAISLKQGTGRLIRGENDRGLLVIADPRMARMGYGKRLRRALPEMPLIERWDEAREWLDSLEQARQSATPSA